MLDVCLVEKASSRLTSGLNGVTPSVGGTRSPMNSGMASTSSATLPVRLPFFAQQVQARGAFVRAPLAGHFLPRAE